MINNLRLALLLLALAGCSSKVPYPDCKSELNYHNTTVRLNTDDTCWYLVTTCDSHIGLPVATCLP